MKRRHVFAVLVALLLLGGAWQAGAEVRLDFDIPIILGARLNVSDLTGTSTIDLDLSNLHIPLPYLELSYQFGEGWLRGGVGVRSYTVIVEFVGVAGGLPGARTDRPPGPSGRARRVRVLLPRGGEQPHHQRLHVEDAHPGLPGLVRNCPVVPRRGRRRSGSPRWATSTTPAGCSTSTRGSCWSSSKDGVHGRPSSLRRAKSRPDHSASMAHTL